MCWDIPNIALWSIADAELPSGQIITCQPWTKVITMHNTNTYANIILYTIACENLHILLIMKPGNFHLLTIWKHALTRIIPVKPHGNWHNLPLDNVLCVTLFAVIINIDLLFNDGRHYSSSHCVLLKYQRLTRAPRTGLGNGVKLLVNPYVPKRIKKSIY